MLVLFCLSFFLPLSFFRLVTSWHLNKNLFRPGTFFVPRHPLFLTLLPLLFGSVMRRSKWTSLRTSLDEAFIRNAKSFYRTSPTLTYPLSFIVRVGNYCVTSRSLIHPCLYKSSTSTCMDLIIQFLSLLLVFEVRTSWSHWILYLTYSMSPG